MARVLLGPLTRALVVENPHPTLDEELARQGVEVVRIKGNAPDEEELIRLLQQHRSQALFKRSRVPVSRRVVEACPELLVVQLCCIGDDSVDKVACADHGVMVFNDPVSNGRSVVELVVAHLIALGRRLFETDAHTRAGGWEKSEAERYEVQGKVLGVLGLGNIGRATARVAEQLGMQVRFFDTREVAVEVGREFGWAPTASVADLLRGSDFVTVHLSATDVNGRSNAGLLSRELLLQLGADRPASSPRVFINLARGFLHTAEDLLHAIDQGAIRRAAVDVFPDEPRGASDPWVNPYRDQPKVAVTPHIGASTQEAQPRIARRVAQTFGNFSKTGAVRDCVFAPLIRMGLVEDGAVGKVALIVAHADTRGTKRAIDDAIYQGGASNLASAHKDFGNLGLAVDLALLDRPLDEARLLALVAEAARATGDPEAIRSVRQVLLG